MSGEKVDALVISGQPETLRSWRRSHYMQSVQITMADAFDVADRGSLRWLQTLSIGNLAIGVFRRKDAFRDRLPQLEILYRPLSADTHADAVSGIATTP